MDERWLREILRDIKSDTAELRRDFKRFQEKTNEKIEAVESNVNNRFAILNEFKFKIMGGLLFISFLFTALAEIAWAFIKGKE